MLPTSAMNVGFTGGIWSQASAGSIVFEFDDGKSEAEVEKLSTALAKQAGAKHTEPVLQSAP
jgi:hypothetical protein